MNEVIYCPQHGFADRIWGLNRLLIKESNRDRVDYFWVMNHHNNSDIRKYIKFRVPLEVIDQGSFERLEISKYKRRYSDYWEYSNQESIIGDYLEFSEGVVSSYTGSEVGIHLRWYDNLRGDSSVRDRLIELGKEIISNNRGKEIFLCSDSRVIHEYFKNLGGIKLIDPMYNSSNFIDRKDRDSFFIDLQNFYNLMKCKRIYITHGNFGRLAGIMGKSEIIEVK